MAYAAAQAVAENQDLHITLVYLGWGGVGKTHLMHAVGHEMIVKNWFKILACTAEDFTNDIVDGIRNKSTAEVRKSTENLMLCLLTIFSLLQVKILLRRVFHTFNAVTSAGAGNTYLRQKPTEISKLEDRLKTRFTGLIVDVSPPDFELRSAIVQIKSEERGIILTNEMVSMIAGNIDSARGIQGYLVKLFTEVNFNKKEVTMN